MQKTISRLQWSKSKRKIPCVPIKRELYSLTSQYYFFFKSNVWCLISIIPRVMEALSPRITFSRPVLLSFAILYLLAPPWNLKQGPKGPLEASCLNLPCCCSLPATQRLVQKTHINLANLKLKLMGWYKGLNQILFEVIFTLKWGVIYKNITLMRW